MIKNLAVVFLFIFSLDANAWWDKGHKIVCDEAYKLLTLEAKEFFDPLIQEHGSFGIACLWPDWVNNGARHDNNHRHYIH